MSVRRAVGLGILSATHVALTLLFQWYVLTTVGAGTATDALFAAMTIPQISLAIVSGSLMSVLVPLFSGKCGYELRKDAWAITTLIGGSFSVLTLLLILSARLWVPLTVPGFDSSAQSLTVSLTRIQLIGMVFAAVSGVQWATYHAQRQFFWAEGAQVLASGVALASLVPLLPRFGVTAAAWVTTSRMAFQAILLSRSMGTPVRGDLRGLVVRRAWKRMKPLLMGTAYYKTDPLADRALLSMAPDGRLSLYFLAQQIYNAATQILNKALAAPLVPELTLKYLEGDSKAFRKIYSRQIVRVVAIGLIGLLLLGGVGRQILKVVLVRGDVTAQDITTLWWIMIWLGGMFVGGVAGQITSSAFYATGDTSTPTRLSVATFTIYIPGKVASFFLWGVAGVAIATTVYYLLNLTLQLYLLETRKPWDTTA